MNQTNYLPLLDIDENKYSLYLDNFKASSEKQTYHFVEMMAGLVTADNNQRWVSSSNVKLLPDISTSFIMLGYKPLSGWGIEEDHAIQANIDNTNSEEYVEYKGIKYKCVKSKTYLGFWNAKFTNNVSENLVDVYVIYDTAWPYIDSEIGVLGIAPNSVFYTYFQSQYKTSTKATMLSLHYQMYDLQNDDYKRLRTGHYTREYASTITVNGHHGSQKQEFFCDQESSQGEEVNYWLCKNKLHVNVPGRLENKSDEILCFANNVENLQYVENPESVKTAILEEICKNPKNCNESDADFTKMSGLSLTFPTNFCRFSFESEQVIDVLKDERKSLKISIGDLDVLKQKNICPKNSTIAVGKRFFRLNELSFQVDPIENSRKIKLGSYKYPNVSVGVWVLLGIGITISVILIALTTYCMILSCLRRGKKHVSHYYIEIDDQIE